MARLLVIHGPNINLLGKREREVYGDTGFEALNDAIARRAADRGLALTIRQSNHEGELVDIIQGAAGAADVIVINAGAFTHTSVAIRDALAAVDIPFVEIHMSNVYKREEFRHHSYLSALASGIVVGFGTDGYLLAVDGAAMLAARRGE
ncbi:MAG: type II 3-dehydroquinate dehydratase [Nitrospinae bacterium]|nr:type II 3-dehydroquinate dehydratase [Nitrospinota bacterium]